MTTSPCAGHSCQLETAEHRRGSSSKTARRERTQTRRRRHHQQVAARRGTRAAQRGSGKGEAGGEYTGAGRRAWQADLRALGLMERRTKKSGDQSMFPVARPVKVAEAAGGAAAEEREREKMCLVSGRSLRQDGRVPTCCSGGGACRRRRPPGSAEETDKIARIRAASLLAVCTCQAAHMTL
jgi:hypothetical protein